MKKKDIIFISIIIILLISLIGKIFYFNQNKEKTIIGEILAVGSNYLLVSSNDNEDYFISTKDTNYQVGDKLKLELTDINTDKTPYEAIAKNITVINFNQENGETNQNETTNNDITNKDDTNSNINNFGNTNNNQGTIEKNTNTSSNQITNKEDNYTEEQVINYFQNLDNELTTYNDNDESLGKTIKSKFVKCIDFIFYEEPIGGKTFSELTNTAKLKILSLVLSIDSKIENKFPGYKDSINSTYRNIKSKIIEKYLEITTNICTNDSDLCITAKENFQDLKDNFDITWDVIKDLATSGVLKLKDWYEIWRYN